MKSIKSLLLATALTSLALTGCGKQTHHGTYQFQMGKANGAHIGIYMDLTKESIEVPVEEGKKEQMEKFVVKFSLPESVSQDEASLIGGLLTYFADGLYGGYKIEDVPNEEADRLLLYPIIDISGLAEQVKEAEQEGSSSDPESSSSAPSSSEASSSEAPASSGESSSSEASSSSGESSSSEAPSPFVIPSEFIDSIMIAKYYKDSISVTVPVSLTNLMFQLYWYGYDIFDIAGEYPIKEHELGTHPSAFEVAEINKTFNAPERLIKHCDLDALIKYQVLKEVAFRDFNQLTMSLKKAVI